MLCTRSYKKQLIKSVLRKLCRDSGHESEIKDGLVKNKTYAVILG